MGLWELLLIAVGLSMDAFAVAVCKGLSMRRVLLRHALVMGLYFGVFQAAMPLLGYAAGARFADKIAAFDHWIAFGLLTFIGGKMVKEGLDASCPTGAGDASLSFKVMLPLALATSIDALAVGISFAFLNVQILPAVLLIGATTLVLSMLGMGLGKWVGVKFKSGAEVAGGLVLIAIGLKILLEHLGLLGL